MRGRKPKPTHIKLISGNSGRRPLNKQERESSADLPEPPAYLSEIARAIFCDVRETLDAMGYASASHTEALALLALRLEEVQRCTIVINEQGFYYEATTEWGETMKHVRPEVGILHKAAVHAQSLLAEFGLTPSSASRIVVPAKQKNNRFRDF